MEDRLGSEAEFDLARREDGGCLFPVTCRCYDPDAWIEFKAAADFDVDLRNGSPERAWEQRYVDQ